MKKNDALHTALAAALTAALAALPAGVRHGVVILNASSDFLHHGIEFSQSVRDAEGNVHVVVPRHAVLTELVGDGFVSEFHIAVNEVSGPEGQTQAVLL